MGLAKEFPIEKMDGFRIGNAQNEEAGTGVTVVLFDRQSGECHCIIRRLRLWTGFF